MNERIQQLIEQATTTTVGSIDEHGVAYRKEFDKEKFAELLVKECTAHLHRRGVEGFGILEERNLKEHFGIE